MRVVICCFALASSAAWNARAFAQLPPTRKASGADTAVRQTFRLYLSAIHVDSAYRLTPNGYSGGTHIEQNVDFATRPDSTRIASVIGVPTGAIDTWNGIQFVSPPLPASINVSGVFSGRLELISNKESFDFEISLYELTSVGDYVLVSSYSTLESVVGKVRPLVLVKTGTRQFVDYESARFADHVVQKDSRLIVLLTILKSPDTSTTQRIATDTAAGTITDPNLPLRVSWYGDSYIELRIQFR